MIIISTGKIGIRADRWGRQQLDTVIFERMRAISGQEMRT